MAAAGQKQRTIYDAYNSETLPGTVVRNEGGPPTGNPAAADYRQYTITVEEGGRQHTIQ